MKDLQIVTDYNNQRKLDIFKGQCFNNACSLYAGRGYNLIEIGKIFELADDLYKEGIKRNYPNLTLKQELVKNNGGDVNGIL